MKVTAEVSFSKSERSYAMLLAHRRNDPKVAQKVPNYRYDKKHKDLQIHYMGILSEMAVAKLLKVDLNTETDLAGDQGYDLKWGILKIDVKYCFHPHGRLAVMPDKPLLADIYILVVGDEEKMKIVGWAKKDDFSTIAKVKDFGYGPRLAIEQNDLRDLTQIL